jgi:hypothetical protein
VTKGNRNSALQVELCHLSGGGQLVRHLICVYSIIMRTFVHSRRSWLLVFVILALAMRMAIPAGWMPSMAHGKATITLCTGTGMVEAWVGADGKIHKEAPAKKSAGDQPCAFAGLTAAAEAPALDFALLPLPFAPQVAQSNAAIAVAIGLAAPPPPATAPPALI